MIDSKKKNEIPNWVYERARCNLAGMFDALFQRVREDVREINKLPSTRRKGHKFDTVKDPGYPDTSFHVYWRNEANENILSPEQVVFEQNTTSISFRKPGGDNVLIVPRWNEAETTCDLLIDNNKFELWEISQIALCDFFFGTIGD